MTEPESFLDNPLCQCFVSPKLCKELYEAGMVGSLFYIWRTEKAVPELFTLAFDEDKYYLQGFNNLISINQLKFIPAYQVKDMEKLLPDYLLCKTNIEYELSCSNLFQFDVEKNKRMPDVFAMMVLKGIRSGKIDPVLAMKKISA